MSAREGERIIGFVSLPIGTSHPNKVELIQSYGLSEDWECEVFRFHWADGRTVDLTTYALARAVDSLGRVADQMKFTNFGLILR